MDEAIATGDGLSFHERERDKYRILAKQAGVLGQEIRRRRGYPSDTKDDSKKD